MTTLGGLGQLSSVELWLEPAEGIPEEEMIKWHISNISVSDLAKGDR